MHISFHDDIYMLGMTIELLNAQRAHYRRRDSFLRKNGWTVLRFSGSQINKGPSKCAKKVKQRLHI